MNKWLEKHSRASYIIGYVLSLALTLNAFALAATGASMTEGMAWTLDGLAVLQIAVQVLFFLHIGREERPRWNSMAFVTMIFVVLFIVVGSIWVMNSLNYNMTDHETIETMIQDEGIRH